jgi:hypothetical protein
MNMLPSAIAVFMMASLVALAIGFWLGRQFPDSANIGEARVIDRIESKFSPPHVLLNNVTLPTEKGTTQIDHILVADTGIFVIETKQYSGWIFGDPFQDKWTQTLYRKKSKFLNPIHQNYGHVKALETLFTLPESTFIPLVVFTGDAEFKTDLGPGVLKLSDLMGVLDQERPIVFAEKKIAYVVGRIEMKRLRRSLETDEYHINYVRRRIQGRVIAQA